MRIFVTGATGFIGSAVVAELLAAGHKVLGMTRSEEGAETLRKAGAEAHLGTLEDVESVKRGAEMADGVIHLAFDHDFANFVANCEKDRRVILALGEALKGTEKLLVITSGVGMGSPGHGLPAVETVFDTGHRNPRIASELAGQALLEDGVRVAVVRLPQVHDTRKQGLITPLLELVRAKGVAAYIGEGGNRWAAGHISDVARLYRLAFEAQESGARYHAVGEEGVSAREIAEALAQGLGIEAVSVPAEEAGDYFGWMAMFAGMDMVASSKITQAKLGWTPAGAGLLEDLANMKY